MLLRSLKLKFVIAFIVVSFSFSILYSIRASALSDDAEIHPEEMEIIVSPKKDTLKTITISAAGDCTFGRDLSSNYSGTFDDEFNKQSKDFKFFFSKVKPILEKDDLTIVNLEGPLTNATKKANKQFMFKGDPSYTQILKEGSVEVVNLANNHTLDYLQQGFDDTINNLQNAQIGYFGYEHEYIKDINGIKIGLIGYKGWSNSKSEKNKIENHIIKLKKSGVNLVIVIFHWGDEKKNYPTNTQRDLGHFAIDSGADLVLGHHPHVIQGIENYKNKNIVYSLGNFSFGGNKNPSDTYSFIYKHTFTFQNGTVVGNETNIIPISISSVKNRNNYQPAPLYNAEAQKVINRLKKYSDNLK